MLSKMELLPTSAPVYGGGLVVAFLPEDYNLPEDIRAFLVFKGSRQRQITEAKISIEDKAFHAVVPDHEPPEVVSLSAYIQLTDRSTRYIATEGFTYFLDQTCFLARYLADSVHNLESLEDWDSIRGENFSLEQEDFGTLDERLTSAFQHLILPTDWNLLGDSAHSRRETLFHFASRLGLSTFVTLLLEKPGAEDCLRLRNKHNELARDIALERGFDGLADLIADPHAHGVIKWESKEEIGRAVILTRHRFGTVSTCAEIKDGSWPSLDIEIEALSRSSCPPDTPIPYGGMESDWESHDASLHFLHSSYEDEASHHNYPPAFSPADYEETPERIPNESRKPLLSDSLHHLHDISDEIHFLRHQDIDRLREEEESGRRSNSCPDLPQDILAAQTNTTYNVKDKRAPSDPTMPRNRTGLRTDMEREIESQLLADDDRFDKMTLNSPSSLERRHSWHSNENLADDNTRHSTRLSVSDHEDEEGDKQEQPAVMSPSLVRRGALKNYATFSVVSSQGARTEDDNDVVARRTQSLLTIGEEESRLDEDRRHTISEATIEAITSDESNTANPQSTQQDTFPVPKQPPAVPPRKKLVTRKLSFLEKMKSSARTKPKEKGKLRTFADFKFGKTSDEDNFNAGDSSKSSDKTKRSTILPERPRSMMVGSQRPYPVGITSGSYPTTSSNPPPPRSLSTLSGYQGNNSDHSQASVTKSNCADEEDGLTPRLPFSAKLQISDSCESLDEVLPDSSELESDPDLTRPDEPDSWSSTIDKKQMKKLSLSKKDVKRQENIYEFILTERNHLTTLKIMQKIYSRGLQRELNTDPATIEKLFPMIDEHVECVSQLVQKLLERQKTTNKVVTGIGDIMVNHWEGNNGETVKRLFGDFCSKQTEITNFYKDLMKTDKKFHAFMKKCEKKPHARRQDVLACALLITQRLTKYPIMLQTMLENSNKKDHKDDYQKLERALELSREIAKDVDDQVQAHEREILLKETYDNVETKSSTTFKDRRFDRKDFLKRGRKLLYSTNLQWNKERGKFVDIFFILLTDCIVMLQENNGRFTFLSGQPAAVPLQKMIVREVANDEKSLYLMSMRTQQMYTLKLATSDECKTLTNKIRLAIGKCPDEEEGITSEEEGERRSHDQRMDRAKQAVKQLELTDQRIIRTLEEKMTFFKTLADTVGRSNAVADLHFSFADYSAEENKFPSGTPLLLKAIEQVNKLADVFYGPASPFKHSLSAVESSARGTSALPKRSDTFGGFDNGKEPSHPRVKYLNSSQSDSKLSDLEQSKEDLSLCNRDSGFHSEQAISHGSHSSIPKAWESTPLIEDPEVSDPAESTYLSPTSDQVQALTVLAHTLSEYQSFAAQQDTLVERLQHQLSGKKRSLGGGLQEAELKRNQIKQQEQMDDLRKQQQQFRNDREQWEKQVERFQRSFDNDRSEFEREKQQIAKQREENEKQKLEIQKAKEYYQSEVKRLKELQRQTHHHEMHSSTTSLSGNKNNSSNVEPMSRSYTNLQTPGVDTSDSKHSPTFAEGDYPRTYPSHKRDSSSSNPQQLPIHMQYSIVNQQAATQQRMKQQQDMSKLSKLVSSKTTGSKPSSSDKSAFHQRFPGKLKHTTQPQSSKKHHIV